MFNKNKLSAAIVALVASGSNYALAQDNPIVEEVVVTGIRASLEKAMDIKRDASGVVDAIAAEDIGKFPDANLAESLQRVPGVSINRNAGEGNTVTVRGFSAEYNMVTLNGRQMPSSNDGRSFNFNDLAAELVSGVEVYKTSSASRASGGIGAVINVTTARPLDIGDLKLAGSVKAVSDVDEGSVTPEISALVSNVFADGKIGALFALSYQQRKYEQERLAVDGWRVNQNINPAAILENRNTTPNTFIAQNYNISVQETERDRTNANLVFQFAPNDDLTVTADYVYSNLSVDAKSSQLGVWFNAGSVENVVINENGTVIDMYENGTFDNIANWYETVSENNAFGLNIDWKVSDSFNLVFDASIAKSEQNPGGEFNQYQGIIGYGNQQRFEIRPGVELPALTEIGWDPNRGRAQAPFCGNGNWTPQGEANCQAYALANGIDPDGVATGPTEAGGIAQELLRAHRNDIQSENTVDELNQFNLEGVWSDGAVDLRAGIMFTDQK
jgi:iron complex outermembrane receptor protein